MRKKKAAIAILAGILLIAGCEKQPVQKNDKEFQSPAFNKALESILVSIKEQIMIVFKDSVIEEITRSILNKPNGNITVKEVLGITEIIR